MDTKQTVLLVEDDSFLREIMANKLRSAGYGVEEATSGEVALHALEKLRPDLILLDLILPEMNGFELVENMKKDQQLREIPVMFLSNYAEAEGMERGKELGVQDYLVKAHVTPSEVLRHVEEFFATR